MPTKPPSPPDDTPAATSETTTTATAGPDPATRDAVSTSTGTAKTAAKDTAKDRAAAAGEPDVPDGRLPAGTYAFTYSIATHYLEVPLTARPADPGRPPSGDDPDAEDYDPGTPATPATVFHWPFSAPADGRWEPTKSQPNQVADNEPPVEGE